MIGILSNKKLGFEWFGCVFLRFWKWGHAHQKWPNFRTENDEQLLDLSGFYHVLPPIFRQTENLSMKNMKKQSLQDEDRSYIFRMSERLQSTKWPSKFLYLPRSWNLGVVFSNTGTGQPWTELSSKHPSGQASGLVVSAKVCAKPAKILGIFPCWNGSAAGTTVYTPKKKFMGIDKVLDLEDFRGILFLDKPKWQWSSTFKVIPHH